MQLLRVPSACLVLVVAGCFSSSSLSAEVSDGGVETDGLLDEPVTVRFPSAWWSLGCDDGDVLVETDFDHSGRVPIEFEVLRIRILIDSELVGEAETIATFRGGSREPAEPLLAPGRTWISVHADVATRDLPRDVSADSTRLELDIALDGRVSTFEVPSPLIQECR